MSEFELTRDNYYSNEANKLYWSNSQYKDFLACSARAKAMVDGDYIVDLSDNASVQKGVYVDERIEIGDDEERLEEWKREHPEFYKKNGGLYANLQVAEKGYQRVMQDELFKSFVTGCTYQDVRTFELVDGIEFKCKFDCLFDDKIVDIKTTNPRSYYDGVWSDEKGFKENFILAYGYDIQGALYQEAEYQRTGIRKPFYIAVVVLPSNTNDAIDFNVIHVDDAILYNALQGVKENIQTFDLIKNGFLAPQRCEECDYCIETKKLDRVQELSELIEGIL